jgi:phosphoribosylcarboxyaminoimidazole (NCAIR) mutase
VTCAGQVAEAVGVCAAMAPYVGVGAPVDTASCEATALFTISQILFSSIGGGFG